jgi:nitroreductase
LDFYHVLKTRRSIRSYKEILIPNEVLNRILESVRIAPSGSNRQPWHWIIVKSKEVKRKLAEACSDQMWIAEAPLAVVACGKELNYNRGGYMGKMSMLMDLSIAFTHLILAARAEGLGTCWIGAFDNNQVKNILKIPDKWNVVAITPLGYPTKGDKVFTNLYQRKPIDELISTDKF